MAGILTFEEFLALHKATSDTEEKLSQMAKAVAGYQDLHRKIDAFSKSLTGDKGQKHELIVSLLGPRYLEHFVTIQIIEKEKCWIRLFLSLQSLCYFRGRFDWKKEVDEKHLIECYQEGLISSFELAQAKLIWMAMSVLGKLFPRFMYRFSTRLLLRRIIKKQHLLRQTLQLFEDMDKGFSGEFIA